MKVRTILALALAGAVFCPAQQGQGDPLFTRTPFDSWVAAGTETAQIKWQARTQPVVLALSQRLLSRVDIQIDGDEVTKRKGRGGLLLMVQYTDPQGNRYQAHSLLDLRNVEQDTNKLNFVYTQDAFVLPGEYNLAMAVFDVENREYSFARRSLKVNPLKNDPLPRAWEGLPQVEMAGGSTYETEPRAPSALNLPVETKNPIHLQLLVNTSPSFGYVGPRARPIPQALAISRVLAAFRVLSQLRVNRGKFEIALLDLTRRKNIFEQDGNQPLDGEQIAAALKEADPKTIDAGALRNRGKSAQYFVEQVRKRVPTMEAAPEAQKEPAKVLIVVSSPITFENGEDFRAIEGGVAPPSIVYYIRQHAPVPRQTPILFEDPRMGRRPFPPLPPIRNAYQEPVDELLNTVKGIKPRVFDVYTPEDLRKAIAQITQEIGRL